MSVGVKSLGMRIVGRNFALLLPLSLLGAVFAQAQSKPLSRAAILGHLALHESPSNIAHQVKLQGINFAADSSYLELISLAGGNGILYERIASATPSLRPPSPDSDPPYRLLAECAEQIHIGASEQAEAACRAAIEEEPKSPWPYLALIASGEDEISTQDRVEFAKRAVAAAPDSVFAHQLLMSSLPEGEEKQAEYTRLVPLMAKQPNSERYVSNGDFYGPHRATFYGGRDLPRETFEKMRSKALEDGGDLVGTHLAIADALSSRGETDRAIAEMREAVRLEPDNSFIHQAFSVLYSRAEDHDSEIAELREAVRVAPKASFPRMALAQHLYDLGRHADAVAEWKDLIAIHPKEFEPSNRLVDEYEKLNDRPSAIAELRRHLKATASVAKAADRDDRQRESHRLASLLYKNSNFDDANEVYLDLLRSDPDNSGIHNDYGIVLLAQNKISEASDQFKEALRIEPTMPEAHNNLGLCLARTSKLDTAVSEFRKALELNPNEPHTAVSLGLALTREGDFPAAIAQYKAMLEQDRHANTGQEQNPEDSSAPLPSEDGDAEESVQISAADIATAENNLAWIYATAPNARDRNPDEALVHAKRAVELLSKTPGKPQETAAFLDTLAEALLINGRPSEALANEEKALSLDPDNPEFKTRIEGFRAAAANFSASKH